MRAAEWLPGLLCQLALVVTRSWEARLHPRQGEAPEWPRHRVCPGGGAGRAVGSGACALAGSGTCGALAGAAAARGLRAVRFVAEALVRTLASYEVVTPARVTELGEVFPQGRHFSRRRRSPEAPEPPPRRTHYRIRAYGQLFQLHLRADAASWPRAKWKCTRAAPRPGGSGARRRPRTCAAASTAAGSTRSGCARPSSASAGD